MQAPLVHAMRPCFSAGRAHRARKSGTEPNEQAPTPVHASSLYRATRQGWGPHSQPPSWRLPAHSPGRSWPLSLPERHGCHSTSQSTPTTEVTARAQIARARLGLVTKRFLEVPPERMQGGSPGSLWPGRALERQRSRQRITRVLRRWLGLTPERPALHLRGSPRRPRVALSRVSDPPGLGGR